MKMRKQVKKSLLLGLAFTFLLLILAMLGGRLERLANAIGAPGFFIVGLFFPRARDFSPDSPQGSLTVFMAVGIDWLLYSAVMWISIEAFRLFQRFLHRSNSTFIPPHEGQGG